MNTRTTWLVKPRFTIVFTDSGTLTIVSSRTLMERFGADCFHRARAVTPLSFTFPRAVAKAACRLCLTCPGKTCSQSRCVEPNALATLTQLIQLRPTVVFHLSPLFPSAQVGVTNRIEHWQRLPVTPESHPDHHRIRHRPVEYRAGVRLR